MVYLKKLKIALLAPANNIHTIRWANGLASCDLDVSVISIHGIDKCNEEFHNNVKVYILKSKAPLGYLLGQFELRSLLKRIKPDLLNAHYASGYGTLARLSGFHPLLLSVWGSDVYDFPKKSFVHKFILKRNLIVADAIASTSKCMALETSKIYAHNNMFIAPFGVDVNKFSPMINENEGLNKIIIGTVKTLKHKYGIDLLLKAFAKALSESVIDLELLVVGMGEDYLKLTNLANKLGIIDKVQFIGFVKNNALPNLINKFDIYVALSRWESFGVAILEASACGKPVVVSDADGPKEVVVNNLTGIIVPMESVDEAACAILKLVKNKKLREKMGRNGRLHVLENYSWNASKDNMIDIYRSVVSSYKKQ